VYLYQAWLLILLHLAEMTVRLEAHFCKEVVKTIERAEKNGLFTIFKTSLLRVFIQIEIPFWE